MKTTQDAFLDGAIEVLQPADGGHRAGMDALLLAASVPKDFLGRMADFGAGCGVAGIAVAHRCADVRIDLIEREAAMAELARRSVELEKNTRIADRLTVLEADLTASARLRNGSGLHENVYDLVIANPPFNNESHRTSPDENRQAAHQLQEGDLEKWVKTALTSLTGKGMFTLIFRPSMLRQLMNALERGFGSIVILPIHPKVDKPANRVLVSAIKGGRGAVQILPSFVLHQQDGKLSDAADKVFRGQSGLQLR